ncbi:MAG: 16S rRNA (cytosine(1402)-N(4))-methyltransferase RsmH [Paludibacteraceae bacterium]|nr:16S rRNA (cytosine(1402)-N(4))-methyltransferase RsmH [Paludibacteraceae bacterium]
MHETYHIPALLDPTIRGLNIRPDGIYVDVTFGGGGHSRAIMRQLGDKGQLYSFDRDADAYANEQQRGELINDPRWHFVHGNFRYLSNFMDYCGITQIDGLLADLGVSFHHFDDAQRGFSFRFEGPLDMRMNQQAGMTAADIVNTYSEESLANVLYLYGELKNSRSIAHRIVAERQREPVLRTEQLAHLLGDDKKTLTLVFQALRIEVNDELAALRQLLTSAVGLLAPAGRIAILTYHSLEDRIVKNFFRSGQIDGQIQKDFYGNVVTPFRVIEKGLVPTTEEVNQNPRARSAKLRVAEKIVSI